MARRRRQPEVRNSGKPNGRDDPDGGDELKWDRQQKYFLAKSNGNVFVERRSGAIVTTRF
jgi:hypothetical protein